MQKDSLYQIKHTFLTNKLRHYSENVEKYELSEKTRTFMHELLTTSSENTDYLKFLCQKAFENNQNFTIAQLAYYKTISNLVAGIETIRKSYPELVENLKRDKNEVLKTTADQYGVGFLSLKPGTKFGTTDNTAILTINSYNSVNETISVSYKNFVNSILVQDATVNWIPEELAEFLITNQMNEVLNED